MRKIAFAQTLTPLRLLLLSGLAWGLLASCRGDDYLLLSEETEVKTSAPPSATLSGLYILCQSNMGSNKCQLDFLDLSAQTASGNAGNTSVRYLSNIYAERNPDAIKELGDVGNDIKIYGSKLWMTINCSNKVEVCQAADTRKLAQIDIPNCRYLAFHEGFAYVSSYVGPVKVSGDAPIGKVFKVDTLSLKIVGEVEVGYQPDELAVIGNRLYVANSGGYRVPQYDDRLSVIDLDRFVLTENITVAPNLYRCRGDKYGQLWVSTRGDYFGNPPALYCLSTTPDGEVTLTHKLDVACSALQIVGDSLYYTGTAFDFNTMSSERSIGIIDIRQHKKVETDMFSAKEVKQIESLYGIIVNPEKKDFYLLDAKNNVSSGSLLHFLPDGTFDYSVKTGDIPCEGAFLFKE